MYVDPKADHCKLAENKEVSLSTYECGESGVAALTKAERCVLQQSKGSCLGILIRPVK